MSGSTEFKEIKLALRYFGELFNRKLLPKNVINGNEVFLRSMWKKEDWTKAEALRVYNIIKPHSEKLRKLNFYFDQVPIITSGTPIKKKVYRLPREKLIGYDKDAFVVYFPYNTQLITAIRLVPGSKWNKEKKYWNVPLAHSNKLKEFSKSYGFRLTEKGEAMLNNITENYEASYKAEKVELNLPFKLEPYPFQSAGIDYGMKNRQIILADEMGLGKTPQGIGVVLGLDAFPALVICPKSLRLNWQNEVVKFTHKKAMIITKSNAANLKRYYELGMADFFIMNYEGARTIFTKDIQEIKITKGARAGKSNIKVHLHDFAKIFKSVILDEAHEARNSKTIRFKTIKPLMNSAEVRICLTGSPIVKGTSDLASLIELIGRINDFGGRFKFIRAYNKVNKDSFNSKMLPANLKELNIKLRSLCFIRREKFQVLKELPDKIRQIIKVDIDNRKEYDLALNMFEQWMIENNYDPERVDRAMQAEVLVRIGVLKKLSAKGKLFALKEFVNEVIDSGEKLVIFCWFLDTARFIKDNFDDVLLITGDISDEDVERNKKLFQNDSRYKLMVVTYKRGGVGHTLTAASKVALIEDGWTWKDESQASDRCHRIGQENTVNIYKFVGVNTVDEGINHVIEQRRDMEKDATGGSMEYKTTISNYISKQIFNGIDKT